MNTYDPISHTVSAEVAVPAEDAFDFLAAPLKLGNWALGCFDTQPTEYEGLYTGRSLFDGSQTWVRIETDLKRYIIDYCIGDPNHQQPRISIRIVPGPAYGNDTQHCIITMMAWRTTDMSDLRWRRLCASHDAEILLIKSQVERPIDSF